MIHNLINFFFLGCIEVDTGKILHGQPRPSIGCSQVFCRQGWGRRLVPAIHSTGNRMHQECRSEHEAVTDIADLDIIREIHRQTAHQRVAIIGNLPALAVEIRHQAIAQMRDIQ